MALLGIRQGVCRWHFACVWIALHASRCRRSEKYYGAVAARALQRRERGNVARHRRSRVARKRCVRLPIKSEPARLWVWPIRLVAIGVCAMARQWASNDDARTSRIKSRRASTYRRKAGLGPCCASRSDTLRPDKTHTLLPAHSRALLFGQDEPCAAQQNLLLLVIRQ